MTLLQVYGTTNLRVADLGVIPLQIAAHTQATAYYVAERCKSDLYFAATKITHLF